MSVDHCRTDIRMSQQFLNRANVFARFQQMSRKAVAQRVTTGTFGEPRISGGQSDGFLYGGFMHMMPPQLPSVIDQIAIDFSLSSIAAERRGGEYKLPEQ